MSSWGPLPSLAGAHREHFGDREPLSDGESALMVPSHDLLAVPTWFVLCVIHAYRLQV